MNVLSLAFQAPQIPGMSAPSFLPYNSPPRHSQGKYIRRPYLCVFWLFLATVSWDIFVLFPGPQDSFPGGVLNGRGGIVAPAPLQPRAATIESVFLPLQVRRVVIASIMLWKKTIGDMLSRWFPIGSVGK